MSEFKVTLGVEVQVGDIQSQINNATDNLKPIELDVKLNGIDKELKSAIKDAQQAGKLISDSVGNSMNKVMSKSIRKPFQVTSHDSKEFERQMNGLVSKWTNGKGNLVKVDIDTKTVFDEEKGHNIEKLHKAHVTYNNDLGETIKKTVALNQIGKDANGNPMFGFVEVAGKYSKTLDKTKTQTGNFIKQQKQAAANLTNQINQLNRAANDQNAARPIKDKKNLGALSEQYNKITAAIQKMRSASSDTFVDEQNNVKTLISEYKSMVSEFKNAENVANKLKGTDFKSGKEIAKNNLDKFKADAKEFPQIAETIAKLDTAIENVGDKSSLDDFNNQLKVAKSELSKVKAEADAVKKATSIQNKLKDTGYDGFTAEVKRAKAEADKLKISSGEVETALRRLDNAMAGVNAANETGDVKQLISANKEYEAALKSLYSQIKLNQQAQKQSYDNEGLELSKAKALLKLENLFESGSQAAKRYGAEMQNLQKEIADCANMADMSHINDKIDILDKQVEKDGLQRQTFGSRIKAQFQKYSQYFSVAQAMMYAGQALRDMFNQVVAIDTAMTELKKVTDETDASYDRFLSNAASRAKEIGTTIDGLVASTADFARLGYSFEQSAGLAEVANIYTVVGDEIDGVETATQSLVSTLAAFKHEMGDMSDSDFAMSIVDKFNEVSNNFAISSGGIGEALQRSASSLAAANNTLDESIALITAANTVVQNPEKVGNAFKTISMRIRGAKTELEAAGESTEGMAESTASLREEIYALSGVDIMKNANEFKSTYAIMDELADKWEGLSDIAQASITELLAGKHQGNVMSSLMANFDIARDALETSQNSAGSAMAEHAKWSDSLEARLNKLKATWQSLSQSFLNSGFLKGGISVITGFADGIDNLVDKFGALPTLIGTFAAGLSLFKNKGIFTFDKDINSIQTLGVELSNIGDKYKLLTSTIKTYNSLSNKQQTDFVDLIGKSNSGLSQYLSGLNGAKASFGGYISSLIGAKVATFALQAATMALNAALTMGISALISWGISALDKWIVTADELAEKVDEVITKYKDQHSELTKIKGDYDTTNEDALISKYGELSKSVDAFGRNLSLTADEYEEYQNIVKTIADQMPSLVSGYDSQGNAILRCAGDVKQLRAEYDKLIKTQNDEVLINSAGDINKDFENAVNDAEQNTEGWFGWNWTKNLNLGNEKLSTESAEVFENILNSRDAVAEFNKEFGKAESDMDKELLTDIEAMSDLLEKAGFEKNGKWYNKETNAEHVKRALKEDASRVKDVLDQYYSDLEVKAEAKKTQAQAALSNALDLSDSMYYGMSDTMKNIARQTVESYDFELFSKLEKQGISVETYVNDMLNSLNSLSKTNKTSIETAFELRTKFNGGDISYGEYVDSIKEIRNLIDKSHLPNTAKDAIKNALNIDGVIKQYDALSKRLQNDFKWDKSKAENFLNSLSAEEFAIAMEIIPELDAGTTASEIQDMIDKEMAMRGLTVKLNLEVEKANIEAVTTALSEMVSGAGMSSDSISAVESMFSGMRGYDPSKLFERTVNGIRLNREEFSKLNSEYSKTNLAELNKEMSSLGDIYNQTREELYKLAYGTDEYNAKLAELDNIENQINSTEKLITQYEGLTSAYQQWQIAESTGNERDMYESIVSGFETVKDELSRGWADDGTIEFLELLTGRTDLASKSGKELKEVYDGLGKKIKDTNYSVKDFFTKDKDGNSTSKGVYNFLDAIGQLEEEKFNYKDVVQRDNKGNIIGFNFDLVGGDEVIAEALGISEELVQIMVRAADDAGFVVSFDGTYQQLDVLREKAQLAAESMNKILEKDGKKTIEIDMNADTLEEIQPQIDSIMNTFGAKDGSGKLTGAIDMSINGAEDALTVVSTLQSMKDKLERPAYMNIQVSQVEDDLKEPLKNLQDYRTKIEQLNQAKLHGADTTELETSIKESKDKVVADLLEIQESNPELAGQLKIEGLSKEEIEAKVEKGDITIPATVDIQLEMDEKLGILVDKALLDAGIIDKEEFNKRVEVYLDTEVNDNGTEEKVNNAVEEATGVDEKPEPVKVIQPVEVNPELSKESVWSKFKNWWTEKIQPLYGSPSTNGVATGKDGRLAGMGAEPITVEQPVNVETGEVNTDGFFSKLWGNIKTLFTGGTVGVGDTGDGVSTGSDGQLKYRVGVKPEPEVNTEGVSEKVKEETKGAIESQSGETTTIEQNANVELKAGIIDDSNLSGEIEELVKNEDAEITVTANIEGNLADGQTVDNIVQSVEKINELDGIAGGSITITANIEGGITDDTIINNLTQFADSAKELKGVDTIDISISASIGENINNESIARLKNFASAIDALPKSAVEITVSASVDTANINNAITLLTQVANSGLFKDYSANVTVTATPAETDLGDDFTGNGKATMEPDKTDFGDIFTGSGTATMSPDKTDFGHIFTGSGTVRMSYTLVGVGAAGGGFNAPAAGSLESTFYAADGTAHANGTAFADGTPESGRAFRVGDWRTKDSGMALMGELGRELIVRDGRFFTVGDTGAGFYPYKKGDIIFNHRQTEELFKNGYVTSNGGRGRAFASGTAFSNGSGGGFDNIGGSSVGSSSSSSSSSSKSNSSSSDKDSEGAENEFFDWIEKLLDRFDRAIDMLDKAANNIYKSFDKRNTSLSDEIAKVTEQISNQQKAYERYMAEADYTGVADGFNLSEEWKKKIRDGDFSISVLNSEDDKELIKYIGFYEEWYEKALDAKEAIQELEETLSSLYALRVENVATQYEGILGVIEHEKNILEEYINQSEAQAWLVSSKYYDALASNERDTIAELQNQKAEMLTAFEEAMASGTIDEGSESWYEMVNSIDEVTLAIKESETALLEYEQTIQQLDWEVFDLLQDKISSVNEETEFLIELLSNKKLYDDNGQLTNEGSATMGLHGVAYNTYMHQADLAAKEIAKLKKELEEDPFDTELEERYREMIALQQEYITSAESQKNAIRDLVEEGIQLELDALDERIEKYNEALDSQKDLYEYQKKVSEQTSEIASLQKQMAAYEGDNSEEAKAKLQELRVSLEEAEADLEETEYDKYISDTQQMLDNITLEYEELLNTRLDNIDYLIEQMITEINADSSIIGDTIRDAADSVGYTLTESMKTIWNEDALSTKNVITTYGDKFVNAQTTTNNALNAININLQNMINQLNKKATTNTKSASKSSVAKSSNTKTTTTKTTTKKSNGGDGKPKIGDRVKYVSGQYYYDSQGKKPLGSHNLGKYVYITNINEKDWATHGYHISTGKKLGSGDLGWLKLNQISGYATGKKNFLDNEIAWTQEDGKEFIIRPSDGAILTPVAKGDSILTTAASKNIWDFANSPAEFIKDNLNLGSTSVPSNSNSQNNYTQYLDKVVISLPNVKNYEQFLSTMQKDRNFERLVQSMTIDQIAGKSSLGKGKSIK